MCIRTWIHCLCPTSSSLEQRTHCEDYLCSLASKALLSGALCFLNQQQLIGTHRLQHLAYLPKTQGRHRVSREHRKPWLSSRTDPSCNSHLRSDSTGISSRLMSPYWCRFPKPSEVFCSWCRFCIAMTGSNSLACSSGFKSEEGHPLHLCNLQLKQKRFQSSNWSHHRWWSTVWCFWGKQGHRQIVWE